MRELRKGGGSKESGLPGKATGLSVDHFDVVTIRIRAQAGWAVIAPAACEGFAVELVHLRALFRAEGDVNARLVGASFGDPENGLRGDSVT